MPKSKEGKKRPSVDGKAVEKAMRDVKEKGLSHSEAARRNGVTRPTLVRHLKQASESGKYVNNCDHKKVFDNEHEQELVDYLLTASKMLYGLDRRSFAKLAYQFAKANNVSVPLAWEKEEQAGTKWIRSFMRRHGSLLALRTPQATSIGRAMCFNKPVVDAFLKNLSTLIDNNLLTAASIYNTDESGLSTVQNPTKVIAQKGVKQVGAIASGERGTNVTLISAVNAVGNSIPPMMVFPRVHFKPHMINGDSPGTVGVATPSGWSNADIFIQFLRHFIQHVRPSRENKVLLLMDNHESHCSIEAINLARDNGIILFTFPPHTTHKLQPLDRSVFGPLKAFYNEACANWLRSHPGEPISIYQVASVLGEAYPKAFTPSNIINGFRVTGIYPFNSSPFTEDEFLPSAPTENLQPPEVSLNVSSPHDMADIPMTPSSSVQKSHLRPEQIWPLPRASVRSRGKPRRRLGKSRILTDTPEKRDIEERANLKKPKQTKKALFIPKRQPTKRQPTKTKSTIREDSFSEDSSSDLSILADDENGVDNNNVETIRMDGASLEPMETGEILEWDAQKPQGNVGDWVLVQFKITPKCSKFYVGLIQEASPEILTLKFLRKKRDAFVWPDVQDVYHVKPEEIIKILPAPNICRRGFHRFRVSFDGFNIY